MIRFLKQHPWRTGITLAIVVLAGAGAAVSYGRDGSRRPPQPAVEHATHGAPAPVDDHAAHQGTPSTRPEGFALVALDPSQAAAMGLRTEVVGERAFSRKVRTVGLVTVDETRTTHVHARVRGWIEGFHVKFVGKQVKKGEPLVSLYSQEAYAAQLELASLVRSPVKSPELLEAARKRLALWDVPRSVLEHVERTGEPRRTFPVLSPRAGVVIAKQAFEGLFIDPSLELYTIADLSRIWVIADIYDPDVAHVQVGTPAELTVEGLAAPLTANVAFLNPTIDERTRTRKVRFELPNPNAAVMPGAFVIVELDLALPRGLAVPESAVIRTGSRSIVFVVHATHAEPREVTLSRRLGDYYRIEAGLIAGDRVATGAQFLLDSESRLRASSAPGGAHGGH